MLVNNYLQGGGERRNLRFSEESSSMVLNNSRDPAAINLINEQKETGAAIFPTS